MFTLVLTVFGFICLLAVFAGYANLSRLTDVAVERDHEHEIHNGAKIM